MALSEERSRQEHGGQRGKGDVLHGDLPASGRVTSRRAMRSIFRALVGVHVGGESVDEGVLRGATLEVLLV